MSEPKALIFDCDGTLADSMPGHYRSWVRMLERYNLEMSEDRFYALGGWPTVNVAELLIQEAGLSLNAHDLADEKEAVFEEELITLVEPIEPVVAIVHEYHGKLPLAVATGGTRIICERILRVTKLIDYFDVIVTCDDVERPKPAPDVYLETARRLGVEPEFCRVYEDADPGIQSALAAGMECVDIRPLFTPGRLTM